MIELFRNPSGEIDLSSRPKPSDSRINQTIENSEDKAKITELRKTIDSLKAEIQAVSLLLLDLLHLHGVSLDRLCSI